MTANLVKFDFNNLVAMRSLQSNNHAQNIVPTELSILVNITKRCNFDCSYCNPHVHDAVSPFVDRNNFFKFVDKVETQLYKQNKTVVWSFTGGEPFVDPSLVEILKKLKQYEITSRIGVISNGSIPLEIYQQSAEYINNLTISLHLERSDNEVNKIIEKIISLNNYRKNWINVNLMFLHGKLEQVRQIANKFSENNIKFVVRKIHRNSYLHLKDLDPYKGQGKKAKLKNFKLQASNRQESKKIKDLETVSDGIVYSDLELKYLNSVSKPNWHNCGVWDSKLNYNEINTDELIANDHNKFNGWICYAGVDYLFVDSDGSIYRGLCMNKGSVGNINNLDNSDIFLDEPTICDYNYCWCNQEIAIRKAKSNKFLNLITNEADYG